MFIGCQFSLYPMTDAFVPVIMEAIRGLDRYGLPRRSSDELSTFLLGPPEVLLEALAATWATAAASGHHVVMQLTLSRGCPGEPDEACCRPSPPALAGDGPGQQQEGPDQDAVDRIRRAASMVRAARTTGQYSVYPLGDPAYMARIMAEIQAARDEGVHDGAKHFMSRLAGSPADIFAYLYRAFARATEPEAHLVIHASLSANSPTKGASHV